MTDPSFSMGTVMGALGDIKGLYTALRNRGSTRTEPIHSDFAAHPIPPELLAHVAELLAASEKDPSLMKGVLVVKCGQIVEFYAKYLVQVLCPTASAPSSFFEAVGMITSVLSQDRRSAHASVSSLLDLCRRVRNHHVHGSGLATLSDLETSLILLKQVMLYVEWLRVSGKPDGFDPRRSVSPSRVAAHPPVPARAAHAGPGSSPPRSASGPAAGRTSPRSPRRSDSRTPPREAPAADAATLAAADRFPPPPPLSTPPPTPAAAAAAAEPLPRPPLLSPAVPAPTPQAESTAGPTILSKVGDPGVVPLQPLPATAPAGAPAGAAAPGYGGAIAQPPPPPASGAPAAASALDPVALAASLAALRVAPAVAGSAAGVSAASFGAPAAPGVPFGGPAWGTAPASPSAPALAAAPAVTAPFGSVRLPPMPTVPPHLLEFVQRAYASQLLLAEKEVRDRQLMQQAQMMQQAQQQLMLAQAQLGAAGPPPAGYAYAYGAAPSLPGAAFPAAVPPGAGAGAVAGAGGGSAAGGAAAFGSTAPGAAGAPGDAHASRSA